jgi:lysozyme family protein
MADVNKLAPFIKKWEGGFVFDKDDQGKQTNMGVTIATFKQYRKEMGKPEPTVDDLKRLGEVEWKNILEKYFWLPWKADNIKSQPIANLLVDWGWGSGPITAIKKFQQKMNLTVDGVVGEKTLAKINDGYDEITLFNAIWTMRKDFLLDICTTNTVNYKFLKGWLNRLYDTVPHSFNFTAKK